LCVKAGWREDGQKESGEDSGRKNTAAGHAKTYTTTAWFTA